MKNIGLLIMSFIIGGGVVFGYSVLKIHTSPQITPVPKKTTPSTFSIEKPPSESLKGSIASRSGTLLWESRTATIPATLTNDVPIQQGERLITENDGSATVNFDSVGTIMFSQNADLSFVQTLPVNFVVQQQKGTVNYMINSNTPLSVRVRSALITKTSGTIQVTVTDDDPIILISTIKGPAQIGFNDLDYVSQVFTLRENQVYEYNSDEHTAVNTKNK